MMHVHTSGTNDVSDGEYTATTGEIPGTDWQYVDGVTSAISSTDSSGVTRSTNVGFMIHDTLLLCAPSTCMTGTGVETGTSCRKKYVDGTNIPNTNRYWWKITNRAFM